MDHKIEVPKTITIDGVEHEVAKLGPQVQLLMDIHAEWRRQLADVRLEVAKHEAALRNLEAEIADTVKKQTETPAEAPAANDAPVAAAPKGKKPKK